MIILGSTGSIGRSAFQIAQENNIKIEMLSAGENIALLNEQLKIAKPPIVAIKNKKDKDRVISYKNQKIFCGNNGILKALEIAKSDIALNALVGFSGLAPSLKILNLKKRLALANKETLVIAGEFISTKNIIPVDSEHFALRELIGRKKHIKKMIITASGGALRDCPLKDLDSQNAKSALRHPNWKMGKKITIDSATMANKLFEVLEAKWLFKSDNIDAIIERNSIIHAIIEMKDNSFLAHFGKNDMRLPIAFAMLGKKSKKRANIENLDLFSQQFHFEKIDINRYPLWKLKDEILKNPRLGVILNASNEILVNKFLNNKIAFGDINKGIFGAIDRFESELKHIKNIDDIKNLDSKIRTCLT